MISSHSEVHVTNLLPYEHRIESFEKKNAKCFESQT